ncbi:flippase [Andreprevotia chitinilytica]|uniref:flippase n=1 Tax=Andreprevotia chitinilytica TaxID=396808 RepID=UPI0005555934|nr:flippase [Andreprevotia chitinilytica]
MTLDARLRGNIFALYIVQGLNYALSLVTFPFLARTLGADGFGVMNYAFAAIQYGVLFTDFGFNLSATREIAQVRHDPAAAARVFWKVTWAKSLLALLSCAVLAVLISVIGSWQQHAAVFGWSLVYIVSSVFFPIWYFQGFEEMRVASALTVLARALMLGLLIWLVQGPHDVALAVVLQAAPAMLAGAIWWFTAWGLPRPQWSVPNAIEIRQSMRDSWPFFLSAISTNLYTTSTAVLLGFFAAPAQVGFFAAANKLIYTAQGLIGPLVQATYPRIAQLAGSDKAGAYQLIRKAFKLQGGAGLGMTLVSMLAAPWIVSLLLGKGMLGSVEVLIWLAPVILLGALSYVYGMQTLLPFGQERYFSRVLVVAGVLNVGLLMLLLPGAAQPAIRAAQVVDVVEAYIVAAFWWRARRIHAEIRA